MKRISFLVLVFLLMLTSSVFATKYDYKDETCNLGKLRSVVVDAVISPQGKVQDADITQKLVADICQRLEERCHLRTATMTAVQQRIAAEKEPDFARIAASDPARGSAMVREMVQEYDAVLTLTIYNYGIGAAYEGSTAFRADPSASAPAPVSDLKGQTAGKATVNIEFCLRDAKTNVVLLDRKELRTRELDAFVDPDAMAVAERMDDDYAETLRRQMKADAKRK